MIPSTAKDLDDLLAEVERQHYEVVDLFDEAPPEAAKWRPDPARWSMTGHIAHLDIVNRAYLDGLAEAIGDGARPGKGEPVEAESEADSSDAGESEGGEPDEPFRHPRIARWFVRSLEPPPKPRMKTLRSMVPEDDLDPEEAVAEFQLNQKELARLIEEARGLDLGKVRFSSPFLRLLRLSVGTGFEAVLAHNRRHLWLIRELMDHVDFPGRPTA